MFDKMMNDELRAFGARVRIMMVDYGVSSSYKAMDDTYQHEDTRNSLASLLNEHDDYMNALLEATEIEESSKGALSAFVECFGMDVTDSTGMQDTLRALDEAWVQGVDSISEYVQNSIDERDDIPEDLRSHIDVDSIVNDIEQAGEMNENKGFVFRCNW